MNRTTVWKIVKQFKETGTTLDKPGRGRKRTVRTQKQVKTLERSYVVISVNLTENWLLKQMWAIRRCIKWWKIILIRNPTKCFIIMNLQNTIKGWEWKEVKFWMRSIKARSHSVHGWEKKLVIQQVVNQQNDRVCCSSSSVEGRIVTRRQNS